MTTFITTRGRQWIIPDHISLKLGEHIVMPNENELWEIDKVMLLMSNQTPVYFIHEVPHDKMY